MSDPNCYEPVCEKDDPLKLYKKFAKRSNTISFDDIDDDEKSQKASNGTDSIEKEYKSCPNNKESLGFFTWQFLHTMAVYYPENPSEDQKTKMKNFIEGLAEFYPCKPCAYHFRKDIISNPPKLENNRELSIWFCEQHNIVNKMLEKPPFDCSWENLYKRYRSGYEHCNVKNGLH